MNRTPFGYELKVLGSNRSFAEYGGINTRRVIALSMAVSGILAGIAGAHLSNGLVKRLTLGLSPGIGFEGIVVALLARNDPIGVLFTGLFYGYLRTGAQIMERSSDVTREVVLIIQAIIILLVTAERLLPVILPFVRIADGCGGPQERPMSIEVVLNSIFSAAFLATMIRISTPILLPALGGLISDLGGVINIALEGQMLIAAFTGVVVSAYAPQWVPGLPVWGYALIGGAAGILAALALSWLMAFFHLELGTDIILTGLAINILAAGVTVFLMFVLTGDKGSTSTLASPAMPNLPIPFVNRIPFVGTLLNGENGTGYNLLSYVAILLVPVVSVFLYKHAASASTCAPPAKTRPPLSR